MNMGGLHVFESVPQSLTSPQSESQRSFPLVGFIPVVFHPWEAAAKGLFIQFLCQKVCCLCIAKHKGYRFSDDQPSMQLKSD